MYFRNVICTVALATLASAAVAKQIPTPYSSENDYEDGGDDVFEREAEAEADPARTAAWEAAHGDTAPSYHYGEEQDAGAWHVARDAEADVQPPAWLEHLRSKAHKAVKNVVPTGIPTIKPFTKQSGGLKKHHGAHKMHKHNHAHTRDVEHEDADDFEVGDVSDEEFEEIMARDVEGDEIPNFGDQEVDTSLEGLLEARDIDVSEDGEDFEEDPAESEQDLSGYDEEMLQPRGTEEANDDLLYDDAEDEEDIAETENANQARDVEGDDDDEYDEYLRSEEHRSLLESIGVTKRDVDDDIQDAEEFDEELFARQAAEGSDDDPIPDFGDEEVDTSLEGLLNARGVEDDGEVPEFDDDDDVDTSLEGLSGGPIHARGVDEEDLDDDVDRDADAAYADEEVVEELVAPPLG